MNVIRGIFGGWESRRYTVHWFGRPVNKAPRDFSVDNPVEAIKGCVQMFKLTFSGPE
jgi:hypothetical protein